jgi:hypothetical protein
LQAASGNAVAESGQMRAEMVVTARRRDEKLIDAPIAVHIPLAVPVTVAARPPSE